MIIYNKAIKKGLWWSCALGFPWSLKQKPNVGFVVDHMRCPNYLTKEIHFGSHYFCQATII